MREEKRKREQEKNQPRSTLKYRVGGKKKRDKSTQRRKTLSYFPSDINVDSLHFVWHVRHIRRSKHRFNPLATLFRALRVLVWHPWRPVWQYTNTFVTVAHETSLISRW